MVSELVSGLSGTRMVRKNQKVSSNLARKMDLLLSGTKMVRLKKRETIKTISKLVSGLGIRMVRYMLRETTKMAIKLVKLTTDIMKMVR